MALKLFMNSGLRLAAAHPWRNLLAGIVAVGIVCGSVAFAANNSMQGAKKDDGGYDTDAPTAILIEASSGSVRGIEPLGHTRNLFYRPTDNLGDLIQWLDGIPCCLSRKFHFVRCCGQGNHSILGCAL